MAINKGLEKQLAKETLSLMVNDDEERVEKKYQFYLQYTSGYQKQLDTNLQLFMMHVYSLYQISKLNDHKLHLTHNENGKMYTM